MKKKTKQENGEEGGEAKPRQRQRRGPLKEKVQVTVRIDQQLMGAAYVRMKKDNIRITDIIERGIYLALKEADHDVPEFTKQVRFVLANATREQQRLLRGLAIAMVEPLVNEKRAVADGSRQVFLSHSYVETARVYEFVKWFLESRNRVDDADTYLEYYSRYGRSAEEIAELGKL